MMPAAAAGRLTGLPPVALLHGGLFELTQHGVAALDGRVQRLLGGLLAGQGLLDIADLETIDPMDVLASRVFSGGVDARSAKP